MNRTMKLAAAAAMFCAATAATAATPEYATIQMEIDIAKPAKEVWSRVGGFCDIQKWLGIDCTITSGDGGVGTVRSLAGGRAIEVLVGRTELSYGYVMPPREGATFYDLYHGFMEARPASAGSTRLVYTLMYDVSNLADKAARDANIAQRRERFMQALQKMKELSEAK